MSGCLQHGTLDEHVALQMSCSFLFVFWVGNFKTPNLCSVGVGSDIHADVLHCRISSGQTPGNVETQRSRNLKNKKMSWSLLRSAASTCHLYKSWMSCSGAVKATTSLSSRMEAHELVGATPELLAMALELLDSPS